MRGRMCSTSTARLTAARTAPYSSWTDEMKTASTAAIVGVGCGCPASEQPAVRDAWDIVMSLLAGGGY